MQKDDDVQRRFSVRVVHSPRGTRAQLMTRTKGEVVQCS
jgi:hypothetical protein